MLEILYRIYEVADEETKAKNLESNYSFGLYGSTSQQQNIELLTDCLVCDSRDQFKEIIRDTYGADIPFRYSRRLLQGRIYCIIIGEHSYNTKRYFNKIKYTCDCCGASIETFYGKPIRISDYEIKFNLYGRKDDYAHLNFCSDKCKSLFLERTKKDLHPSDDEEFYVSREMFTESVAGYIYKITKKSTGEFYIGQTKYPPMFRWAQHLKTTRFPISDICDYTYETLETVTKDKDILDREKHYIKKFYKENPEKSLNISNTSNIENKDQLNFKEIL